MPPVLAQLPVDRNRGKQRDPCAIVAPDKCARLWPVLSSPHRNNEIGINRLRPERYIGEYVLPCPIRDQAGQGMRQNGMIGIPVGAGSMSHGHH
jgi:hypothetical protein